MRSPALVLAVGALVLVATSPAGAAERMPVGQQATLAPTADVLARRIADAWRPLQRQDGNFRDAVRDADPLPWRDPRGAGTLGAALVMHGLRTDRDWAVAAGLKAVEFYARMPLKQDYKQVFQTLTLATAYDLGVRRLRGDPRFRRLRPLLERRLRQVSFKVMGGGRDYYNYYLVEALGALIATEHPLRSGRRDAMLHDPAAAKRRARRFLAYDLPGQSLQGTTGADGAALTLLSDPPGNPPAYHAFSSGLLAQALLRVAPHPSQRSVRTLFDRMARASWASMAPDGDVAWFGRSQEQSWALAMSAAGAAIAARLRPAEDPEAARMRTTALRALERLETTHASARFGVAITPSIANGVTRSAVLGLDTYVTGTAYTGLTLLGLEWLMADRSATTPFAVTRLGAETSGAFRLARTGEFTTVRRGDVWYAVKREPEQRPAAGSDHSHDLRYDAGLNGLKVRDGSGTWTDVLPPRPFTDVRTDVDTAGPTLVQRGSVVRPEGARPLQVDPGRGTVTLTARLRRHNGEVVRSNLPMRFLPAGCGVRIEVPAKAGEQWWYSVFFRATPRVEPSAITDGVQRVTVNAPFGAQTLSLYASGLETGLRRVRITATPAGTGPLTFTICRDGVPES